MILTFLLILIILQYGSIIDDIKVLSTVIVDSLHRLIKHGADFKRVQVIRTKKESLEELEKLFDSKATLISNVMKVTRFLIFATCGVLSSVYVNDINYTYISAVFVANIWLYESECSRMRQIESEDDFYSVSTFLEIFDSLIRMVHTGTLIYFLIVKNF